MTMLCRILKRAALVVGVVLVAVACSGNDATESTTEVTSAEQTTPAAAGEDISVVMEAIDAWNRGEFDAWLAFWVVDPGEDHLFSRSVMNSGEQMEVTEPCHSSPDPEGTIVECSIRVEDNFHGAGGLTSDATMSFIVNDVGLIVDTQSTTYQEDGSCCPKWESFHTDFHRWLQDAHPDVYADIGPKDGAEQWWLPGAASGDPDHMLVALEYVEEFVAQSDSYPLVAGD